MQASFIGFKRSASEILLVMSRDILPTTQKRLSMFVLRSKAKLRDASAEFELRGLAGDAARAVASKHPWELVQQGEIAVIALYPADGQARALWIAPVGEPAPAGEALAPALWAWGGV